MKERKSSENIKFYLLDIEDFSDVKDLGTFDLIVNSFSLFEMPLYSKALRNEDALLKANGSILVFSINPISQIMAISKDYDDFKFNCIKYSKFKDSGYYNKKIDTGVGVSNHEYMGILHSLSDYYGVLKDVGYCIRDYEEINLLSDFVPKIYEYVQFCKND